MANSVNPDQTAPLEVLFWYAPTALTYLSRHLEFLQYLAKTDRGGWHIFSFLGIEKRRNRHVLRRRVGNSIQTTRCLQHLKSLSERLRVFLSQILQNFRDFLLLSRARLFKALLA